VPSALAHVMVVGGTRREWVDLDDAAWEALASSLGAAVADEGGSWLTIRAYESGPNPPAGPPPDRRVLAVADGRCTVIIDAQSDGRELFADAVARLPLGAVVDEKSVTAVLYEPADVEPDLVIVLGPSTQLPPSLVWELAYGELVFVPQRLADLDGRHVTEAIEAFRGRQRRFGGLDT
jgi:undecaprenyl diphosphate synthase